MYAYPYGDSQQLNLDWILTKLKELEAAGLGLDMEEVSNALISLTYNTSTAYTKYDYAFRNGKLYRCLTNTSGAFDPAAWQEALIGDDLAVLTRWINAIDAAAVVDVKFDTSGTNGKIQQKYNDQYHDVVEVDYTPVQNSKRPLSSNAGYELNDAISNVFNAGTNTHDDCNNFVKGLVKYGPNTLNIPVSGYGFVCGYIAQSNSWKWQIAMTTNTIPEVFIRNNINNGGWTAWKRIADEDDISTLNGAINHGIFAVEGTLKSNISSSGNIFTQSASDSRITSSTKVASVTFEDESKVSSFTITVTPSTGTVTITGTTASFSGTINVVVELYN